MRTFALPAILAASLLISTAGPSLAFDDGCDWDPVECNVPPPRPVFMDRIVPADDSQPRRWHTVMTPPLYGTRLQRVRVAPGVYENIERPFLIRRARAERIYEAPVEAMVPAGVEFIGPPPILPDADFGPADWAPPPYEPW